MMRGFRSWAAALVATATICAYPVHAGEACPEDLDGSGLIDFGDLLRVLTAWGPCPGCPEDLDFDDVVGFSDLLVILTQWGPCPLGDVTDTELAGNALPEYPFFEYVLAFNEGAGIEVAVDPGRFPSIAGATGDIYVVAAKSSTEWAADPSLTDVTGGAQTEAFVAGTVQDNTFAISGSVGLDADAGTEIGVPYDIVIDFNQNGTLDDGDFIDGRGGAEGQDQKAGAYLVHDVTQPGPLAVVELAAYSVGTVFGIVPTRTIEEAFYPSNIASMGEVPLLVISHGNGHQYTWYDHIGAHMASYGYIVMSHQNNTGPGVTSAATTTTGHTDAFLDQLDTIAGGVLEGHIDSSRISWMGHSRGGEGVNIAYDRVFDGVYVGTNYSLDDIKLVSSIAPTVFNGPAITNPHSVNFHLWTGGADADVNGCAGCNQCQTYQIHDRAEQIRTALTLYGAGHGDFHSGPGAVAQGPCLVGESNTHQVMRGYYLPLVKFTLDGNIPARDFLTRQWESFRPIGAPSLICPATSEEAVVVNLEFRDGDGAGNFMVDDFQTQTGTGTSSSGGSVTFNVNNFVEDRLDDGDLVFTWTGTDPMNGMTQAGPLDSSRGIVFDWVGERFLEFEVIPARQDLTGFNCLSFRACQGTQHPLTISTLGDLTFNVVLRDGSGATSTINIGAYGGGLEEPYQRIGTGFSACGPNPGWANQFETIRIRLTDFLNNGSGLDLSRIEAVRFEFGPSGGASVGRIGMDEIEITTE